nr:MAG TPA: hypothetical protein [Caudoviricetes sp.]
MTTHNQDAITRAVPYSRPANNQERYFLPVDSARKGAIRRGHLDRDLANTTVAALTALSKSINK